MDTDVGEDSKSLQYPAICVFPYSSIIIENVNNEQAGLRLAHIEENMQRQPAVAGYFYPGTKSELEQQLGQLLPEREKMRADAIVVPHAGYIYSGAVAGEVYASVILPDTFIILCPNHTGQGSDFDIYPEGEWLTPLGPAYVDQELVHELIKRFPRATKDGRAHIREHSLEVQLPFLQYLKGNCQISSDLCETNAI